MPKTNIRYIMSLIAAIFAINAPGWTVNKYPYHGKSVSYTYGADDEVQRYKYNGKELDRLLGLDWYDYGARMYDPILCRWNRPDPLADDYLNVSPYVYCLNNPIKLIDIDGLKPGDFFRTADEAAIDFGLYYNDNSIREGVEYGSSIFKVMNNKGEIGYTYTIANRGNKDVVISSKAPWGFKTVATTHTHGRSTANDSKSFYDNYYSGMRDKKHYILPPHKLKKVKTLDTDIGNANIDKIDSYLASPNGELQKYNHRTGKIKVLSNEMPSDPNDPDRQNSISPFFEKDKSMFLDIKDFPSFNQYLMTP